MTDAIKFTLDGREVEAQPGETIWQIAKRQGTLIPHLCWLPEPGYRADGNCRACMVEIEGERVLAASCIRKPTAGMKVVTASDRAKTARKMVMELLLADQPKREVAHHPESKLWQWADHMAVQGSRFPARTALTPDLSHPAMAVHLDACIHCNLCVRACREVQVNDVIGMAYRNIGSKIVFDMDDPMGGSSTCVACGECVQACPTGALMPSSIVDEQGAAIRGRPPGRERVPLLRGRLPDHLQYQGRRDPLRHRAQRPGQREPAVRQRPLRLRLCQPSAPADQAAYPQAGPRQGGRRPTSIRRNPLTHFREASWEEALDFAARA